MTYGASTADQRERAFEQSLDRLQSARRRVESRLSVWAAREERFALLRLILAAVLVMVLVGFYRRMDAAQVFLAWLGFFIVFFLLSAVHSSLKRVRARCEGLSGVFTNEILRARRDWDEIRKTPMAEKTSSRWVHVAHTTSEHPYKSDLDLAGNLGLWLDTCTLEEGSQRLIDELLLRGTNPLSVADAQLRRARVEALSAQSKAMRRWESYRMGAWLKELQPVRFERGESPSAASSEELTAEQLEAQQRVQRSALEIALLACVAVQLALWGFLLLPTLSQFLETADTAQLSRPLSIYFPILVLSVFVWESWRRKVQMSAGALGLRELKVLAALEDVARCVPGEKINRGLVPVSAGRRFKFLRMTFELGEVRRNPILWLLLNVLFPYDALSFSVTLVAYRLIDGRFEHWWNQVVEFDFLSALARVQLENKNFTWPAESLQEIHAEGMAHPLLRSSLRIGNDLALDASQRCMLLTGSNMAGKSTLLRALAVNALLAQLGTVVCARQLRLPPLEILCAIQVSDSLESGASYFYAEVRRLAAVLQRLQSRSENQPQRLFLIDEIFRGTNNKERFLGSWQVISALLSTGAFGLLTTHDLALTALEKDVAGVRNFHLRETVGTQGALEFDYLLRPGPCPTTNALIIMRQAGLPIELNFVPSV
ncbi:hypothetical protein EBU99_08300 [bacterium]|nr:hypothetical protein [bacterium]